MIDVPKIVIGYILGVAGFVASEYVVLRSLPMDYFFKYEKTEIIEPVQKGGAIRAVSHLRRYRAVDMRYQDTLFCDEYGLYSSEMTTYDNAHPSDDLIVSRWAYKAEIPAHGHCWIKSAITAELRYGIIKGPQEVKTQKVEIGKQ